MRVQKIEETSAVEECKNDAVKITSDEEEGHNMKTLNVFLPGIVK